MRQKDFAEIETYGVAAGIFDGSTTFDDYADPSFVPEGRVIDAWKWEMSR